MTPLPETTSTTIPSKATKPKRFYGRRILVGAAVLSFVAALASLHEHLAFRGAIEDSVFESDRLYRATTDLVNAFVSYESFLGSFIAGLVIAPVVGFLLDRHGPRPVMLFCVLVVGIFLLLITQVQNELQMHAALWIIRTGVFAITSVVVVGTLGKWFVHKRVLAFAIVSACAIFASMFSLDTISAISEYGWQITAIIAGIIFLIVGIPIALMMRRQPEDYALLPDSAAEYGNHNNHPLRKISATARSTLRIPVFWQLALAVGLVLIAMSAQPQDLKNTVRLFDVRFFEIFRIWYLAVFLTTVGIVAIGFISLRLSKRILFLASFASLAVAYSAFIVIDLVDEFAFEFLLFFIFTVVGSVAQAAILFVQFAILADFLGRRNFGVVVGMAIAVNTVISDLFSNLPFYAYDILGHDFAQFGVGMTALIIAALLILKMEPQSRVAARIRRANRRRNPQSAP